MKKNGFEKVWMNPQGIYDYKEIHSVRQQNKLIKAPYNLRYIGLSLFRFFKRPYSKRTREKGVFG